MKARIEQLKDYLEANLRKTAAINKKSVQYYTAIKVVRKFADRQREIVLAQEHPFPSQKAEIAYFKHTAPHFYSQLYYYIRHESLLR
jgi:hypothetical protein